MVRTRDCKLISRPQGQSELYVYKDDPQEVHNRFGESSIAGVQAEMQEKLLNWYINTTGIAPRDKDQRGFPTFNDTPRFPEEHAVKKILDAS